jgi:hypothetical protein
MGEYIGASIRFGGKLRKEHVAELVDLLNAMGLTPDFDGSDDVTVGDDLSQNFGNWEINYGLLDELQDFGIKHGLDYIYWHDSGSDWSATSTRYVAATENPISVFEIDHSPAFTIREIKELGQNEILRRASLIERPLPPLEIVE